MSDAYQVTYFSEALEDIRKIYSYIAYELEVPDTAKLELYRLIGEGYNAMQEGRTSTIEEVREKLEKRIKERD